MSTVFLIDRNPQTFDTFTQLYDARDAGNLSIGVYRVSWSGDTYAADGEFITHWDGSSFSITPFETAIEFPTWLWSAADWSAADSGLTEGVLSFDGDDRPIITVSGRYSVSTSNQGIVKLADRYGVYKPRLFSCQVEWDLGAGASTGTDRAGIQISDVDDDTTFARAYAFRTGPSGHDLVIVVSEAGSASSSFISAFTLSDPWEGEMLISTDNEPYPIDPTWAAQIIKTSSATYTTDTLSNGHGTWRNSNGLTYVPGMYLTTDDTATTLTMRTVRMLGEGAP